MRLLEIEDLSASYLIGKRKEKVLKKVNLSINRGERVAIVGESGSGKSTLASILLRLEPENLLIESGKVLFEGIDLISAGEEELEKVRGRGISVILQNPSSSLDPLYTVGEQISEALRENGYGKDEAKREAVELLRSVGIPNPEKRYNSYPHQLSGGQKQRVAIAIAIALRPKLIVADEPTSALDVSTQTQIIELLNGLTREYRTSLLLITHDIGVAYDASDRIVVMYGGMVMEEGKTEEVVREPIHPYTSYLLSSIPLGNSGIKSLKMEASRRILQGNGSFAEGCPFYNKCPLSSERCSKEAPRRILVGNRAISCWKAEAEVVRNVQ
ncbi:MAG: ABC transporter ATP-binding protein [Fervidicoccaceae archaeon]|jgi:oligopeptide/dipeptide ABC transporter ATP-binding protein